MTLNGIEVDETREDESADLIVEAGRIARGEDGYKPDRHVQALVDELGGALTMARDTLRNFERVDRVLGRIEMAEAAKIAGDHAAAILARLEP